VFRGQRLMAPVAQHYIVHTPRSAAFRRFRSLSPRPLLIGLIFIALFVGILVASEVAPWGRAPPALAAPEGQLSVTVTPAEASYPATPAAVAPLLLGTSAGPAAICALNMTNCNAGTGEARVTLTASAATTPKPFWPNVQIAFVIETTAYDGDADHYNSFEGTDPCAVATSDQGPLCEESNGVPFFIENAGTIAQAIQAANPHSNVSFAMVDFFGTDYDWNDGPFDSWKYHVDVPDFVPSYDFGAEVHSTFQAEQMDEADGWGCICGLDDNFLHSSSITALYGAIIGSGLDWSLDTHHVVVLMGSTAPRDPNYPENYWVSGFDICCTSPTEYSGTCEPSYVFSNGVMPNCEGWIRSQDGNPDDSIAALTRTSPTCTDSIGGDCTIDVVDYWDTPTDPYSQGWPTNSNTVHVEMGGTNPSGSDGPGGYSVIEDSTNILLAGCDLAAATGGSWSGPSYFTCPNGDPGSLQYVEHGPLDDPDTNNPTLFTALRQISFGPVYASEVANGTAHPLFTYVPPANFVVAPSPQYATACLTPNGFFSTCQTVPEVLHVNGVTELGWNWSTNKTRNQLYVGDTWSGSFNIINTGQPFAAADPVLACTTTLCLAGGSGPVMGQYSSVTYSPPNSTSIVTVSFPLATVAVIGPTVAGPPPIVPPPAPPIPPAAPIVVGTPTPVLVATPTTVVQGVANISLQATAAGFLGAGFMRVSLKNRPIAMKIAAKSGAQSSKFDADKGRKDTGVGRFV
jgi:hypothetical protein